MALIDIVFGVLRCVVFIYDIVTFPVYSITQQSWKERSKQNLGDVSIELIELILVLDIGKCCKTALVSRNCHFS
jgi:hypothetical protein